MLIDFETQISVGELRVAGVPNDYDTEIWCDYGRVDLGDEADSVNLTQLFQIISGPPGTTGPTGPRGPSGPAGGEAYPPFEQMSASALWTVNHNLGRFPAVTVVDSGMTTVEGVVHYVDDNNLIISFAVPFSGTAYLN